MIDARRLHLFAERARPLLPPDLRVELDILAGEAWRVLKAEHGLAQPAVTWALEGPSTHVVDGLRHTRCNRALAAAFLAARDGSVPASWFAEPGARNADGIVRRALRTTCCAWAERHAPRLLPFLRTIRVVDGHVVAESLSGLPRLELLDARACPSDVRGHTAPPLPGDHGTSQPEPAP